MPEQIRKSLVPEVIDIVEAGLQKKKEKFRRPGGSRTELLRERDI